MTPRLEDIFTNEKMLKNNIKFNTQNTKKLTILQPHSNVSS